MLSTQMCIRDSGYTMQIAGSGVKSTTSELDTMLILTESDQGIEFELDKGKALPCSCLLYTSGQL